MTGIELKKLAVALMFLLDCKSKYDSLTTHKLRTRRARMAAFALWYSRDKLVALAVPGLNVAAVLQLYATHGRLWLVLKNLAKTCADKIPRCVYDYVFGETVEAACVEAWLRAVIPHYDEVRQKICLNSRAK
ncbi:MAG: hypothetical protein QXI07_09555 [Pyrobaculum sp.]